MKSNQPFFNTKQDLYTGSETCFYSNESLNFISKIEDNYLIIKNELEEVLSDSNKRKIALKKFTTEKTDGWNQIELKIYGINYFNKIALFPKTIEILKGIHGVSTIYFSLLDAGAIVKPHVGDTDAFHRVHLGLEIPSQLPECGIQVAGESRSWQEGKCLAFNDIYYHTAWNKTDKQRIVLIIDVIREPFIDRQLYVNSGVRATLAYARIYNKLFFVIELFPRIIQRAMHPVLHSIFYVLHKFRNPK